MEAAAVEEALADTVIAGGEQSDCDGSPDPIDHMHGHGADRIVDLGDIIEEFDAQDDQDAGNEAEKKAPSGETQSQGAVMATRPASAALKVIDTSGLP